MDIETFALERNQSLWENHVACNLTESGLHPFSLADVLSTDELAALARLPLGYGHTEGDPELRARIAALYPGRRADDVIVTNGSAEANYLATWTLLRPGDEIVYMLPNYLQIHGIARSLGATVVPWRLQEQRNWAPSLDALEQLVSPRTKAIVVCNPNNPTGAVLADADQRRVAAIAARVGCVVHSDEIYRGSELGEQREGTSFAAHYERTLVTSGLSKALGFPGLRIGWIVGPSEVVAECRRRHDYTSISTNLVGQFAATRILAPGMRERLLARGREHLRANLATLTRWLARYGDKLRLVPPSAGGMAFIGYGWPVNSTALATRLREEAGVFVVAGDWFGMDGYLRIGIGVEERTLRDGLARMDRVLATLG